MDSLRYWVDECHVDGFRFDLATALARELYDVDRLASFFDVIHQDPILSQVKLIAEPWDVGPGGYQVGNFPVLWSEWNGIYRDVMRDFWRGAGERRRVRLAPHRLERPLRATTAATRSRRSTSSPPTTASRSTTSSPTTRSTTRPTTRTTATGPTTTARGTAASRATTDDPEINALREPPAAQLPRHAVPLPGHADAARRRRDRPHAGRQQQRLVPGQRDLLVRLGRSTRRGEQLLEFTQRLIALRRDHPVFRRRQFLHGTEEEGSGLPDAWWFRPDGRRMTKRDWDASAATCVGMFLNGEEIAAPDRAGRAGRRRLVPAALQRAPRGRASSRCRPRRFGAAWTLRAAHRRARPPTGDVTLRWRGELHRAARAR